MLLLNLLYKPVSIRVLHVLLSPDDITIATARDIKTAKMIIKRITILKIVALNWKNKYYILFIII